MVDGFNDQQCSVLKLKGGSLMFLLASGSTNQILQSEETAQSASTGAFIELKWMASSTRVLIMRIWTFIKKRERLLLSSSIIQVVILIYANSFENKKKKKS